MLCWYDFTSATSLNPKLYSNRSSNSQIKVEQFIELLKVLHELKGENQCAMQNEINKVQRQKIYQSKIFLLNSVHTDIYKNLLKQI